jgi:ABC-type arginine/histidine transport system permease subunit
MREEEYTIKDNLLHFAFGMFLGIVFIVWLAIIYIVIKYTWPVLLALLLIFFGVEMFRKGIKKG